MLDEFANVYADPARAESYARLEYHGTYHLAVRDLPAMLHKHVHGRQALDFGCGAGRSTRYLRDLGYHTVGVDIAEPMLAHARTRDPQGEYRLLTEKAPALDEGAYDLVFAAFTFDNILTVDRKVEILQALRASLKPRGRIVMVVSDPAIYRHEWVSFSTQDFPENRQAHTGDVVRIVMRDVPDRRPVEDILCTPASYREIFQRAGLIVLEAAHPRGRAGEPYAWVSETTVSPWTIYVLRPPVVR